jgi:hypothetical protein
VYFVYSKGCNWVYLNLQMYVLNVYEQLHYMCIHGLLLALNSLDIIDTLDVYFEYIKVLCKKFIIYIYILWPYYNYKFIQTILLYFHE